MSDVVFRIEYEADVKDNVVSNMRILWMGCVLRGDTEWYHALEETVK